MLADAEKAKGKAVTPAEKVQAVKKANLYKRMVEDLLKPAEEAQVSSNENELRGKEQETIEVSSDQGRNNSEKKENVKLSDEIDDNGRQFVLTSKGDLVFGEIHEDTGLTAAPILLSEGMITNPTTNDGYGLAHIEARHGDQIRKAGYKSVVEFIETVAKNYDVIREGNIRDGHQTYRLLMTDKHNNTLMVELSGDGSYWNINTAGIFKTSYGKKRKEVYNRHTTAKQPAETVETSQNAEQGDTQTSSRMNVPTSSSDKDKNINGNVQGENDGRRFAEQPELNGNHEGMTAIEQADGTHKWVGLQRSEVTEGMSEREVTVLDEFAKRMGLPIVAVDIADSRFNGKYADGVVYINVNRDKDWTMRWVAGHELLHDVERLSPEAYNAYKDAVRELFGEEYFEGKVKDTMDVYAEAGQPISREQAEREVVNDFGGDLFSSRDGLHIMERILDRAKRDGQPKLVKMLLDWWDKVKDFFGTTPYANDVRKALEEAYADAMRNANERMRADDGKAEMSAKRKRALETAEQSQRTTIATAVSSADGTKILKNLDKLVNDLEKSSSHRKTFIGDLANAFGVDNRGKASKYATFETKNGKVVTIRLSNHNATVSNFDSVGESDGISIVVTRKPNKGITNDGMAHIVEFFYPEIALQRAEGKPLAEIAKSIKQVLYSGEFKDTTGLAEIQEVNRAELDREPLSARIESASAEVNTEPTEAQKEAGNYKKGHVKVGKFDISIEQPEGSIRRGTDADGKQWESKMHNTYGYFRGTEGVDGDHIDVFLSKNMDGWNGEKAFVVDQYNPDGTFDEHKVMLGFNDAAKAKSDYLANYEKGWENGRRIDITGVNLEDFEKWIDSSHRKTKPFGEYKSIKPVELGNEEFSIVSDKKKIKELENSELVPMYRTFQEIDGKLYPPMANIQDGERSHAIGIGEWWESDERPDLAMVKTIGKNSKMFRADDERISQKDGNWVISVDGEDLPLSAKDGKLSHYFNLKKGGKGDPVSDDLEAAYNPYIHSSESALNDQFKGAYLRPNLVLAKVLVPKSELDNPYKAKYAKDATGRIPWNSGAVMTQMQKQGADGRTVALSRHGKVNNVFDASEWADRIDREASAYKDTIELPFEAFQTDVLTALWKKGYKVSAPNSKKAMSYYRRWLEETGQPLSGGEEFSIKKSGDQAEYSVKKENTDEERKITPVGEREKALRDAVIGRMRKSGIDVIDNDTEGQRVLDMVNGKDVREHKVYHGSGADFEAFDHSHMGEGEGLQAHGWGTYVTMNEGLAKGYAIKDAEEKNREEASLIWKRKPSSIEEVMRDLEESYPESFGEWLYKKWYNPYRAKLEKILKTIQYGNEYDLDGLRKELSIEIENPNNSENEKSFYSAVEEVVLPYALAYQPYERNLYSVEIPKNNGQNYIEEFKNYGAKTKLRRAIESALQRIGIEGIGNDVMSGREIYTTLTKKLGSKEKASKFLGDLGLMGVHYYGASDGECYVIFNESDAKITDHVRFFRTADGEAYGFTVGGKVYIDPRIATAETPVHEYTHLWSSALRTSKPNDWQRVVGLMKDTAVWEEVKSNYKELKTDDDIADEVLAQFSGKRGAERLRAEMQKAKGDAKDVAENALNKVKQALADFWKGVCDMLGVKYTSADDVADKVLSDLLEGVNPTDPDGGGKRADESLIDYAKRKAEQYSIKKSFGGNSGYVGYSKSKRAVDAEDRGLRSVSNMDREFAEEVSEIVSRESGKEAKVSLAEVKRIAKDMRGDEWHHTSKYGNRTQYYSAESIAERILADREPKSEELVADDKERESALGRVRDALVTDRDVKTVVVDRGRETEYTNDAFTSSNGYQIVVGKGMFGEKRTFRNTQFLNNDKVDKRELYLPEWYMDDHIDELQKAMDEYNASLDDALGKEADAIVDLPQYSIKIPEGGVRRFFELYPTLQDYKSKLENDFDLAKRYYEKKDNIITERAFYDAKSALEYADIEYRRAKELLAMYDRKNTGVKAFKPLSLKPSYKDPEATKKLANILGKTHTIDYSNYIQAMEALKMNPFLDNAEKYLNYEFGKEKSMYGDYREAFPTITMDDYFLFTKVEFKPVDTNGKSVDDVWQELKDSGKYEEHHSPKSTSKYLVDYNSGEIIRQSDHWGLVASCYWPYGGEEIEGEMQIGRTNIAEMKPNLNYNAHGRSNRQNMAALPKQSENVWKSLQQTIVNYEALLKDDRFNLTEEVRDIINNRILAYGQFADNFMSAEIPDSKIDLSRFHGVSYSIKGARGANDFANGNGFIVKKGDEAIGEMMRIFEEKRVPSLQESIKGISEFKRIFANPIQTILGKMIRVKDEVYNKMLRKSRGTISSAVLPTLQDADFVIRESNGSTLYVKRFKNNENEHIYNIVVVNKQNEVEDYISSAHIKTNNNLLNKIKQGAELLIPTKRTNYGILSPSNSTPDANVGNNSEPANKIGENFSIKNGKKESDFKLAEQNLADEMHYGKKVAEKLRQIEEMKQGIKDGNAQVKDIAKQMREFIEESVPNEMQDDMTRLDFKGVLKALDTATTTKDLEKPMRTVDEIGTYLASRALNKRLGEILSKKYRSTNAKGVAVARAVDNTTRVVMDYAKQLYRDMGNNGVSQQLFGLRLDRKDIVDEMKALAKSTGDADISAMVESVEKVMKAKQDKRKAMLTELRDEMSVETASKVGGYIDQLLDTQEKIDSTIAKGDENISKAPENAVESLKTLAQEIGEREDAGTMSEDDRAIRDALPLLMMITDIRQRTIDNNGVGIGTVENKIRTNQLALKDLYKQKSATDAQREAKVQKIAEIKADIEQLKAGQLIDQKAINNDTARLIADFKQLLRKICA